MIPALGVMIAAYTVSRLIEIVSKESTKTFVKIFCLLSVLVIAVSLIDILNAGTKMPRL